MQPKRTLSESLRPIELSADAVAFLSAGSTRISGGRCPMNKPLRNVAASVRQRLLQMAHASGQPNGELLDRYCIERLLYRLSRHSYLELRAIVKFGKPQNLTYR